MIAVGHTEAQHPTGARARDHGRASSRRSPGTGRPWRAPGSAPRSGRSSRPRPPSNSRWAAAMCARRTALWKYGPSNVGSSASMPIHASASMIPWVHSGRLRASSVSSMRSTNVPPRRWASAQLYSAVRAPPTWKKPVGDGANRRRGPLLMRHPPYRPRTRSRGGAGQPDGGRWVMSTRFRNWRRATDRVVRSRRRRGGSR